VHTPNSSARAFSLLKLKPEEPEEEEEEEEEEEV